MLALGVVQSSNTSLVTSKPLVAVFVGGTAGIGAFTVRSLAATHGKDGQGLRVYIIGRNTKAAEEIISDCHKVCPSGEFKFIRANDLALIKDVDLVCAELSRTEESEARSRGETPRIDLLIMTQANFKPWDPRNETAEGLDTFMSLLYYSRMRFIMQLTPLLHCSSLPAHVVSVYGPGRDTTFIPDDLSLRSPTNYSFSNSGSHAAYLTTFFMEHLAAQNAGKVALVHYFPGLVLSDVFQDPTFPFWFRAIFKYLSPLLRLSPMTLSGEVSGQRTLFNASKRFPPRSVDGKAAEGKNADGVEVAESSNGVLGGGAYRVNYNGEQVATGKQYEKVRAEGWLEKVVEHTLKAFEDINATGRFTG